MGYSCSVKANITYNIIHQLDDFKIQDCNYKYFCDIGNENIDGSMTGTVYKSVPCSSGFGMRNCKKAGSFKINADGTIVRFPGVSKRLYGAIHIACIEKYDRQYATQMRYWEGVSA